MGINISEIKNLKLKEIANLVDKSYDGKTRDNGMIDDCELSIFIDSSKTLGMEAECTELLGLTKQNVKAEQEKATSNEIQKTVVNDEDKEEEKLSLTELKDRIAFQKSKIRQLMVDIYGKSYLESTPRTSEINLPIRFLKGAGATAGFFGIPILIGNLLGEGLIPSRTELKVWGCILGGLTLLGAAIGTGDAYLQNCSLREAKENEKKHPELMEQLNEARQELEKLQKRYDEYTW